MLRRPFTGASRLRRVTLALAALLVVAFTALVVLAKVYDAEVKVKLLGTLNGYLVTPVTVSSMDLTLIERFPQASIHLRDVLALEVRSDSLAADTLFYAGDLFLEFSLLGMLRGDYTVDEVHGEHVVLHPALDTEGRRNWEIWKRDTTSVAATAVALDRVTLDDLEVRYRDARTQLDVLTTSEHMRLGGTLGGDSKVKMRGDAWLRHWSDAKGVQLSDRRADLKLELAFGGEDRTFRITKGEVAPRDAGSGAGMTTLAVTMSVAPGEEGEVLDLRANGMGLDLAGAVMLLPDGMKKRLDRYGIEGEVDLALSYKGPVEEGPTLAVGLNVRNGRMKERRSGAVFSAINGECAIDLTPRGALARLFVKGFSAKAASGTISGSWDMKGVKNAPLKAEIKGDIALADLLRFAQVDTLEQVEGRLIADARLEGKLRDVSNVKPADLRALHISGTARLKDATLKMKGLRHSVTALNTELVLDGNDASVRTLTCTIQGNALTLHGELRNLMPYLLFDDQSLLIAAKGSSPHIDLGALLSKAADAPTSNNTNYGVVLPALIGLDLEARVDELVFEEFRATDLSGTITLKDRVLRASPVMLKTASGGVLGSLSLDGRAEGDLPLAIDATVQEINVRELFAEFQEFGQEFITSHHLTGTAQAQVNFSAPLSPALILDLDRLRCVVDVAIDNGAIKDHKPLMDVATYVRGNKLIAPFVDSDALRDRLANVTFARLENRVEIRDRMVVIPAMDVRSSALDIELSGTHGFDDQIDHHLNFRLGELLKRGDADDEFGPVVDDGTGLRIFLHMHGPANAPQFETDGAMAAQRRSAQVREQTAELRSILREDLNPFIKKDGSPANTSTTPPPRFEVEWNEGDSAKSQPVQKPKKKKGLGRLLEESEEDKEVIQIVE